MLFEKSSIRKRTGRINHTNVYDLSQLYEYSRIILPLNFMRRSVSQMSEAAKERPMVFLAAPRLCAIFIETTRRRLPFRRIGFTNDGAMVVTQDEQRELVHEIQLVRVQRRIVKSPSQIGIPILVKLRLAILHLRVDLNVCLRNRLA